jgi:SRSO17 transposase
MLPIALFSRSTQPSNVPLPEITVQNLDPYPCNEACMQKYLDNGLIFSYLSYMSIEMQGEFLSKEKVYYAPVIKSEPTIKRKKIRIALLMPYKTIGRYAASTTNASFAYLISKESPFELKSYKIEDESYEEIFKALNKIKDDGFEYVIAPMTQVGEKVISKINPSINIYFPTINKKDTQNSSSYLYYGGIDYRAQIDMLLKFSSSPLVIFYDNSEVAQQLSLYEEFSYKQNAQRSVIKFEIPQKITNLEKQIKDNSRISGGSFFLNTPIVKSGMIMSQLTLYDTSVTNILSTQANYNPLLLSMTQYRDRKEMIIANSITINDDLLVETNSILQNDIVYDWINYTTTVGMDYFSHLINNEKRSYDIEIKSNQMIYPIKLFQPSVSRFIPYN